MALTTEQARDILSKVTDMSPGLFQETKNRVMGKMVCITYYCDVEGDDYNVLINGDKVIEINNSATSWHSAVIENILNPPVDQQRNVPQGNLGASMANPTVAPSQYTNMPAIIRSGSYVDQSGLQQFISSFVALNPGCVSSLFGAGVIPTEVPAQDPNAWIVGNIDIYDNLITFNMYCSKATDQNIANHVTAEMIYDTNTNTFVSVSVLG